MEEQQTQSEARNGCFSMKCVRLLRLFSNTGSTVQQLSQQVGILKLPSPPFNNVQVIRGSPCYRGFCGCSVYVMLRKVYECMEDKSIKCF